MARFQGRGVVVTGAGSGIGRETALRFAAEGAHVLVADIDETSALETSSEIVRGGGRAEAWATDVADYRACEEMVRKATESFGTVDVLVNNAAVAEADGLLEIDENAWDRELDIDLKGVYACSQAALRRMVRQRSGVIVNITSVNALAFYGHEAYSAAKAGIISLTRSIAIRHGRDGVRCNAVAPGTIRTPAWRDRVRLDPAVFERVSRWYALGRVGEPEDVASAVLFLASDEASWITGTVLRVDGGLLAGNPVMTGDVLVEGQP